jgi:hypothetical protein
LLIAPQNRWEDEDGAGLVSRSNDLLHVEISRARIFQSGIKTGVGAARMGHVSSSQMLCRCQVEDE